MVKSKHKGDVVRLDEFHKNLAQKGAEFYEMSQTELIHTLLEKEFPTLTRRLQKKDSD